MFLLKNFLVYIMIIILCLACFISLFNDVDPQDLINSDALSLDTIMYLLQDFESTIKITEIQESLKNVSIPVPDVPVLGGLVSFLNSVIQFILFLVSLLLSLVSFIIGLFSIFFAYVIV